MRKNKRYLLKNVVPFLIFFIIVLLGLIRINIINTKTLSPLGTTKENYEIVSNEFGNDFSNFIKDNAEIKIYTNDKNGTVIKIKDTSFIIKNTEAIINDIKEEANNIKEDFKKIKENIEKVFD